MPGRMYATGLVFLISLPVEIKQVNASTIAELFVVSYKLIMYIIYSYVSHKYIIKRKLFEKSNSH